MYGQMLISGFRALSITEENPIVRDIKEYNLGGVILYDKDVADPKLNFRNIKSPSQTKILIQSLRDISNTTLLIGVDQEGGEVQRLNKQYGFPDCPAWGEVGSQNDPIFTQKFSAGVAQTLSEAGFNVNFAPVVDLDISPLAFVPREGRCFSSNPEIVAKHSRIFMEEHLKFRIAPVMKHYPGLGSTTADTHEVLTDITETWSDTELEPYRTLLNSTEVPMVMVGHCFHKGLDPNWPASMSQKIITGLLRNELGFKGVVICDDPRMGAISKHYSFETVMEQMINAGVDLFCFGNNLMYDPDIIPKAVNTIAELNKSGKISNGRIDESLERISTLKTFLA